MVSIFCRWNEALVIMDKRFRKSVYQTLVRMMLRLVDLFMRNNMRKTLKDNSNLALKDLRIIFISNVKIMTGFFKLNYNIKQNLIHLFLIYCSI